MRWLLSERIVVVDHAIRIFQVAVPDEADAKPRRPEVNPQSIPGGSTRSLLGQPGAPV